MLLKCDCGQYWCVNGCVLFPPLWGMLCDAVQTHTASHIQSFPASSHVFISISLWKMTRMMLQFFRWCFIHFLSNYVSFISSSISRIFHCMWCDICIHVCDKCFMYHYISSQLTCTVYNILVNYANVISFIHKDKQLSSNIINLVR